MRRARSWIAACFFLLVLCTRPQVVQGEVVLPAESSTPSLCPYDYTIIERVSGNVDYYDSPIELLEQSNSTVKFVVGNKWETSNVDSGGDETLDQLFTLYKRDDYGSLGCILNENVASGRMIAEKPTDIIQAHCTGAGISVVTLFVHDSTFVVEGTKTTKIPKCCHDPSEASQSKERSTLSYVFVINCRPTCSKDQGGEETQPDNSPTASHTGIISDLNAKKIIKQSLPSVDDDPLVLSMNDGDILELDNNSGQQDSLSLLLEMDVDEDNNIKGNLKPVGRSYNGNPWETYAGEFSSLVSFDCKGSSSSCRVALPHPQRGRAYVLKSNRYRHDLSKDDLKARFLERTTFGPTKTEINAFTSPENWMEEQFNMDMTSHRQFYRERVSQWHAETNNVGLLSTGPCDQTARYRRYAILSEDDNRFVNVAVSPYDPTKLILTVSDLVRTVVDGPLQFGNDKTILGNVTIVSSGRYEICQYPFEGVGGRLFFKGAGIPGCKEVYFNDIYGNPAVNFDDLHRHLPEQPIVKLDSHYKEIMKPFFFQGKTEMLALTSTLDKIACNISDDVVAGFPERVVIGQTDDAVNGTQYWIHSTTFKIQNNDIESPLQDGGKLAVALTQDATDAEKRFRAKCSSAPRTFLNEEFCQLSEDACYFKEGEDVDVELSLEKLKLIHDRTGGRDGEDTRYVYAVTSLQNDPEWTDTPCTPGARSRWIVVDDCTPPGTSWDVKTKASFEKLLTISDDVNPFMRDVFFPTGGDGSIACSPDDLHKVDFKIEIDGICYENTHPDNLQVFDMTYWTTTENKIKDFADKNGTWFLPYPQSHDMEHWNLNKKNFPNVGRFGDKTTLKSLPSSLFREDVAQAFGSARTIFSTGKVLVCGSPFEVANVNFDNAGTLRKGGFDMRTTHNATSGGSFRLQREHVWNAIALDSQDQLRQRTAFALSQIFSISPDSGASQDFTESYLSYYDIFVRHAFGNYFDIMKEVTYHPVMSFMLTYRNGYSTAYSIVRKNLFVTADENYAREIMQLFSVGLKMLNNNGTIQTNADGSEPLPYTNEDIAEYAKVYLGFWLQNLRGNIDGSSNQVDPLRTRAEYKDHLPKLGMNSKYIGDGYPLCIDLPSQHFLKRGAIYRLLGSDPNAELLDDPRQWYGAPAKRVSLNFTDSILARALCNGDGMKCNPQAKVILQSDIQCIGIECDIVQPRTLQVAEGLWFEYVLPPCVNHAFYNNAQSIRKRSDCRWKKTMCGNPKTLAASTICCDNKKERDKPWRKELFSGERVSFETALGRCSADKGLRLCNDKGPSWRDCYNKPSSADGYASSKNGGCDSCKIFYWLSQPCSLNVKVGVEGSIAIIHEHSVDTISAQDTYRMVRNDTKMFFRADWKNSKIDNFLSNYTINCKSLGCFVDEVDGVCQCSMEVDDAMAFVDESDLISMDHVLETATVGAFPPSASFSDTGIFGVQKYPSGKLSEDTIFKIIDSNGRIQYRKNTISMVVLGNGELFFRNPVTFWSLSEYTVRDARYELDAALEHYFYHQNVAPFVAYRLAQRFGTSNPSPRYIDVIATAFRTGTYVHGLKSFGSNEYGCLQATIAAVILDREAQDHILDTDPTSGHMQEPLLKYIRLYRSLDFVTDADNPLPRFTRRLQDRIGQAPYNMPSVFSFFMPEYSPPGVVSAAGMVSPESQVLDGPTAVSTMNLFVSHLKYGPSNCYSGIGISGVVANGWRNKCAIGNNTYNLGNNKYLPSTYGLNEDSADEVVDDLATLLTSGRLSPENRAIMKEAFYDTLKSGKGEFEAMINVQQLMALSPEFHTTGLVHKTGKERSTTVTPNATDIPYKAVIYVMLSGGMDSWNVLVPESCSGKNAAGQTVDKQYLDQRDVLAFDRSKGEFDFTIEPNTEQPCEKFAINKELKFLKELYSEGDLIFLANTGVVNQNGMTIKNYNSKTRSRLFDHNGMQQETKKVDPYGAYHGTGVLGRAKDVLASKGHIVNAMSINGRSITVTGTTGKSIPVSVVSSSGVKVFGKRPREEGYFKIEEYAQKVNSEIDSFSSVYGETWSDRFLKGVSEGFTLNEHLGKVATDTSIWKARDGSMYDKFSIIAKLIKTRSNRNSDRDIFYTGQGGFDHHSDMKRLLGQKLNEVDKNLRKLVEDLKAVNLWNNVTIVVTSEFGRTITPNSNFGSDHAWGGNYFMLGGQVKGGRVVGKYPNDLTKKSPLNAGANSRVRFMPTTSWDSVWHGIVQWFGVGGEDELDYCLPNRNNTVSPVKGAGEFPLLNMGDLYDVAQTDTAETKRNLRLTG